MEIPRHWRLKKQRYGLVGEVCLKCDKKIFPPRPRHECDNESVLPNKGVLPSSPNKEVIDSVVVYQNEYQSKQ